MSEKLTITEETAQLILDAIAWCNQDWLESLNWDEGDKLSMDRGDFVRFCNDRGIETIERTITLEDVLKGLVDDED